MTLLIFMYYYSEKRRIVYVLFLKYIITSEQLDDESIGVVDIQWHKSRSYQRHRSQLNSSW